MAGITGFLGAAEHEGVLPSMLRKLSHRGGNTETFFYEADVHIGFCGHGFGAQLPFRSDDVAVFIDGHIDNAAELRDRLMAKGLVPETGSHAELVALLYRAYGTAVPKHLRGAFVFALYDFRSHLVMLARDHMGIQPLCYTTTPSGSFVFASEIKAVLEHPGVQAHPDMMMIDAYLSLGFCPGPQSMFKGVHTLPPGHSLIWNPGLHVHLESFWTWDATRSTDIAAAGAAVGGAQVHAEFARIFDASVKSSVASLTGAVGVAISADPATQALALSARKAGVPVTAYGAYYRGDDAAAAAQEAFAKKLGLSYHGVVIQPSDIAALPEIIWAQDQPVADPEMVSRYMLARTANHHVGSLLAAEASPDVMSNHALHRTLLDAYQRPKFFYGLAKPFVKYAPVRSLEGFYRAFSALGSGNIGNVTRGRLLDFVQAMHAGDVGAQYLSLAVIFNRREKEKLYSGDFRPFMETYNDRLSSDGIYAGFLSAMQGLERKQGVTESILNGFGRIGNLAGIDLRLPFADPALADFMRGLPDDVRMSGILEHYVANGLQEKADAVRSVAVAPFPFASFTSSLTLREMIGSCLSDDAIRRRGILEQRAVRQLLQQAKAGDMLSCRQVFSLLSLEMWFRVFVDQEKGWISS